MKKQKLKNYLKFGILLFGISIILTNCQKDDDMVRLNDSSKTVAKPYSITKIGKLELQKNKSISTKINHITKSIDKNRINGINNKIIYSAEYDFFIDTDYANYIENEDGTYHSYTFSVQRTVHSDIIENLVFSLKEDGAYSTTLVSYNTNAQQKENLLNGFLETGTSINITYTPIENDILTDSIFKLSFLDAIYIFLAGADDGCYSLDTEWGDWNFVFSSVDCGGGGGDTSGGITYTSGNIPSGTGTGGGGSSTNNPQDPNYDPTDPDIHGNGSNNLPVLTSPINSLPQDTNPKKLKILTQHPQIKAKITELRGKISEGREYGYQFNISGNNPITYNPIEGELASDNHGIKFPPASAFTQLEMHTHFVGLDNAFTASDIYKATKLAITNPNAPAILVAPNGKLYALMVTDQSSSVFKL